jgi:hypothetical protein
MAWFPGNKRGTVFAVVIIAVYMLGYFTLANGFEWMRFWPVWLCFALCWFMLYQDQSYGECVAGVEWLARRHRWVRLYELVEVTYPRNPLWPSRLRLRDSGGRRLTIRLRNVRADRLIWDLTYLGIEHSVIAGNARTNEWLHRALYLPRPASHKGGRAR